MTTFTIHTDDCLAEAIRAAANEAGRSINVFLKEIIGSAIGVGERSRRMPSFMNVPQRLSSKGMKELRAAQESFSEIDEELWK